MRILFFVAIFFQMAIFAADLNYSLIKKGDGNNTMLVIGGIQGDEPGGFFAANLLAMEYNITKGSLWVVPNLNFDSIVKNNRGIRGDMNRKFAKIEKNDPDFNSVKNIKSVITNSNIDLIVHLHDGSGFYREKFINALENPKRWGNSAIIDQEKLENVKFGELATNAKSVITKINEKIKNEKHKYHLKNTRTADKKSGDAEQLNSLTYYAISNKKATYANEASKELDVYTRVFYHLLALEEYMKLAGIEYTRGFELSTKGIEKILKKEIQVNLFGNKFLLALDDPREHINYIPTPNNKNLWQNYESENPLLAIVNEKNKKSSEISVYYGNKKLTNLRTQNFEFSSNSFAAPVKIDQKDEIVTFGTKIKAEKSIEIKGQKGIRVNVIGYENKGKVETDTPIKKDDMQRKFSIDKAGKIFRVEFYEQEKDKKDKFLGMFLVEFAFSQALNGDKIALK